MLQYPALSDNGYPAYHTGYETLYLVESLIDPDSKIRETCSKLNLRLIRDFADSVFLDFRPEGYGELMTKTIAAFVITGTYGRLKDLGVNITTLDDGITTFKKEVGNWRTRLEKLDYKNNPMIARYVNDQVRISLLHYRAHS